MKISQNSISEKLYPPFELDSFALVNLLQAVGFPIFAKKNNQINHIGSLSVFLMVVKMASEEPFGIGIGGHFNANVTGKLGPIRN